MLFIISYHDYHNLNTNNTISTIVKIFLVGLFPLENTCTIFMYNNPERNNKKQKIFLMFWRIKYFQISSLLCAHVASNSSLLNENFR